VVKKALLDDGVSHQEVAGQLGVNADTVRKGIKRGSSGCCRFASN
jgi:IS30 family transposase